MVIFGLYGIGKTHLVLYVKELLSDSALVKYVEMPTCHRRSHFRDLAQIMMKAVGKPNFMNYLRKCFVECKSVQEKMQELEAEALLPRRLELLAKAREPYKQLQAAETYMQRARQAYAAGDHVSAYIAYQ